MGLFDFLFGSDESSTNGLFDIEDYRSVHENRRHRASGSSNWTSREDWTLATTTTMLCRDLIRMRIMIFNASALIIFGTTFGTIFGTKKKITKKITQTGGVGNQHLPLALSAIL